MKKKTISFILTIVMLTSLFPLSACSKTASNDVATTDSATSTTSDGNSADTESTSNTTVEPLTIKFSSTYQESETGGIILKYFIDRAAQLSNNAIDVDISWGGTLFTAADELDAIMDGSVNMVALGHLPHLNTLTYLAFPSFAPGGSEEALNYFQTIMFDDSETSALIQGEAKELGIKYLNVIAGGANAFCSKNEFTDLDSLISNSSAFGNTDAAIFENLEFQVTYINPSDIYDSLNRGLVDTTQMALAPMVAMSWYEPAPYWALDGTYTAGNFFTVNLDWWDGLTESQREVIQLAAQDTQSYTATLYDDAISEDINTVEEKTGNTFVTFSDEDIDRIWAATFDAKADSALQLAETAGKTEGMTKILEKAAELTDYDWKH